MKEVVLVVAAVALSLCIAWIIDLQNVETNWERFVRSRNRIIEQRVEEQARAMKFEDSMEWK